MNPDAAGVGADAAAGASAVNAAIVEIAAIAQIAVLRPDGPYPKTINVTIDWRGVTGLTVAAYALAAALWVPIFRSKSTNLEANEWAIP